MVTTHTAMHTAAQTPDTHLTFMEQRLEGMKAVQKARTDLYNVLTPEQKAIADQYWTGAAYLKVRLPRGMLSPLI